MELPFSFSSWWMLKPIRSPGSMPSRSLSIFPMRRIESGWEESASQTASLSPFARTFTTAPFTCGYKIYEKTKYFTKLFVPLSYKNLIWFNSVLCLQNFVGSGVRGFGYEPGSGISTKIMKKMQFDNKDITNT
jgi:hypothetical protein